MNSVARVVLIVGAVAFAAYFFSKLPSTGPEFPTARGLTCETPNLTGPIDVLRWVDVAPTATNDGSAGEPFVAAANYEAVLFGKSADGVKELARSGRTTEKQWTLDAATRASVPKWFRFEVSAFDTKGTMVRHATCECQRP